jgi:hypothetical protein
MDSAIVLSIDSLRMYHPGGRGRFVVGVAWWNAKVPADMVTGRLLADSHA